MSGESRRSPLWLLAGLLTCTTACHYQPLDFGATGEPDGGNDGHVVGEETDPALETDGDADPGADAAADPTEVNHAPVVNAPSAIIVPAGATVAFDPAATDEDGDALTFDWSLGTCTAATGTATGSTFTLVAASPAVAVQCTLSVSVSDGQHTTTHEYQVTIEGELVGTYVDNTTGCINADYVAGLTTPQGTPAVPWCTLFRGLEAARALNRTQVFVSTAVQHSGIWLEVDDQTVEVIGGYARDGGVWAPGGRTLVAIDAAAESGWKLWDYDPGNAVVPSITLRHFDLVRTAECTDSCALVTVENVTALLDDVRVGNTDSPTESPVRHALDDYVGIAVAGNATNVTTKLTLVDSIVDGAMMVGGFAGARSFGIRATGTAAFPAEVHVSGSTVKGGDASQLAAALHSTGLAKLSVSASSLVTLSTYAYAEQGYGLLDGAMQLVTGGVCGTSDACNGSGRLDVTDGSTVAVEGYAVGAGLALLSTDITHVAGAAVSVIATHHSAGVWLVEAGTKSHAALDFAGSSVTTRTLGTRVLNAWPMRGSAGLLDGLFSSGTQNVHAEGSRGVVVDHVALDVTVGVGLVAPDLAVGALLLGSREVTLDFTTAKVQGARNEAGSAAGALTVAGIWTLSTQDVRVSHARVTLPAGLAMTRVAALMDGVFAATNDSYAGSSGLEWSLNQIQPAADLLPDQPLLDGAVSTTLRACAMAAASSALSIHDNVLECVPAADAGAVPSLWLADTSAANVDANTLIAHQETANSALVLVGIRDGRDGADLASPDAGSSNLAVTRNVVRVSADPVPGGAVGLWLGAASYAAPVANNAVTMAGPHVAVGARLTGEAQVSLRHNTLRLGGSGYTAVPPVGVGVHLVIPPTRTTRITAVANNVIDLGVRPGASYLLEQGHVSDSRLDDYYSNVLMGANETLRPALYATATSVAFPPPSSTRYEDATAAKAALTGMQHAFSGLFMLPTEFCSAADPFAYHYRMGATPPLADFEAFVAVDIDGEARIGGSTPVGVDHPSSFARCP